MNQSFVLFHWLLMYKLFYKQGVFTVDIFQNLDICLILFTVMRNSVGCQVIFCGVGRQAVQPAAIYNCAPSQTETEVMSAA